jgi:hypothetical protein
VFTFARDPGPDRPLGHTSTGKHIHVNFDDLQMEHRWSVERATEQSRLGIYCLTRELGLRLKGSGVAVNVLDLGHVYTSDQSLLSRAWCNIKGDTPDDMAKCVAA